MARLWCGIPGSPRKAFLDSVFTICAACIAVTNMVQMGRMYSSGCARRTRVGLKVRGCGKTGAFGFLNDARVRARNCESFRTSVRLTICYSTFRWGRAPRMPDFAGIGDKSPGFAPYTVLQPYLSREINETTPGNLRLAESSAAHKLRRRHPTQLETCRSAHTRGRRTG